MLLASIDRMPDAPTANFERFGDWHDAWSNWVTAPLLLVAAAGSTFGCNAEQEGSSTPMFEQAPLSPPSTICGADGNLRELYVFDAINSKLSQLPVLRERFGSETVDSCTGARRFMKIYRELQVERPEHLDAIELQSPDNLTASASASEPVESIKEAVSLGSSSADNFAIRLDFLEMAPMWHCSGTSISTYGILTAAHCIPYNGWHKVLVLRMSGNVVRPVRDEVVFVHFNRHPDYMGRGDWSNDIAVGTLWYDYHPDTLPDPATHAVRLASSSPTSMGMRYEVRGYGPVDVWGTGFGVQRKGEMQANEFTSTYIGAIPVSGDLTPNITCKGDSGGPLSRIHGSSTQVQWAVTSSIDDTIGSFRCATGTHQALFTRVNAKLAWIESQLGFTCKQGIIATGTPIIAAKCW